ncbi:inactive pancreatic lipase-related protein 1-like [Gigantopelta aegis]|uniref:inactive pancreatic lipase-related protein 1-like n=1 Tax=Gigantopelta aegis TaxID=1735272 RepID=UPI001B889AEC|nr:inactive pancreatic lipase-related protein 1-like [Gigantopelta aegis]
MSVVKLAVKAVLLLVCVYISEGWLVSTNSKKKVCYRTWGCFYRNRPFHNSLLPRAPSRLGIKFKLYTKNQPVFTISINETRTALRSNNIYNPSRPTKVIIHGFQDSGQNSWVSQMVRSLLEKESMNVFVVDWKKGAKFFDYFQACSDARLIGRIVAKLLETLIDIGASPASLHLIGHSLGAHIAGYVAEQIPGVGRITGLDPAGPSFEGRPTSARLDSTDAIFVDVIHTDAEPLARLGLGIKMASGHVDFYVNGGVNQPGCPNDLSQLIQHLFSGHSLIYTFACSHMRAIYLFTESINSRCQFKASPCPQNVSISSTTCNSCHSDCVRMGYYADIKRPSGTYYIATNENEPYCMF